MKRTLNNLMVCLVLAALLCMMLPDTAVHAASTWDGTSSNTAWPGSGTSSDPYIISTAAQLKGLADQVNSGTAYSGVYFKLGDDINLSSYAWTPIGGHCELTAIEQGVPVSGSYYFGGIFDGDNHLISGINISNPAAGTGAYGLFGYVNGGTLANLKVSGSLYMGDNTISEIGAVVGYTTGSLYNLHSSMTVSVNDSAALASQAGGIAGVVQNTGSGSVLYVRYCSNSGNVTGRGRNGGVLGAVYCVSTGGVVVDQCYNTGRVTSTYSGTKIFTGGIVGYCMGYLSNCYNQGNLTTNNGHYIAGVVGILNGLHDIYASMSNCYSTAVFSSYNPNYDRWLWGSADFKPEVHITNCFWLPNASNSDITQPDEDDTWGTQIYVSSITADELKGTVQMTESNRSGTFSGYVVNNYLGAADPTNTHGSYGFSYAVSGGYPVLYWQQMSDFKVDLNNLALPPVQYSITALVDGGNGSIAADPVTVNSGGSSIIIISPDSGYWIRVIKDNGNDVLSSVDNNTYTIDNITGNHSVAVTFTNGYQTLTYSAGAHGSISGTSPQSVYLGNNGSAVTAVADSGYHFAGWSDNSTANPRTDTSVTDDIAVKAIFIKDNAGSQPTDHFTIAVLPDTQYYSESYPAIFDNQTQWIADNAWDQNIIFVAHVGDLVNVYNSAAQWQNAHDSMSIIRASGVPYSVVPGNHDVSDTDTSEFDTWFPYTGFENYTWYGGHYPDNSNSSNYELFSAMGQDFIVLNLICTPSLFIDATDWANDVLTQYSGRKAIVVTHGYIDAEGNYLNAASVAGRNIWYNVVSLHSNVIAVLCGHYSGEYYNTATGTSGNTIYNLLTDYQDDDNGGDGWLRLYEFYPQDNKIKAFTWSPYLEQYDTTAYGQFDLSLQMTYASWDLNGDNVCNIGDVVKIGLVWGETGTAGWIAEDTNEDGVINIGDVVVIGLHWGETI